MTQEYSVRAGIDSSLAKKGAREFVQSSEKVARGARKMGSSTRKATKRVSALGGTLRGLRGLLPIAGFAALGAAMLSATRQALAFNGAMAEVSTLLGPEQQEDMGALTYEVLRLSSQFAQAPTEQAKALYGVISAGASTAAEAAQTLTAANKLAVGGVTDVATASDGLTSILNAYRMEASQAGDVSDALFVAMRAGKTTVGELARSIGQVAPITAKLGIELDETLGAISAITKQGISTSESVAGLRQVLVSILRPTGEAVTLAEQLGIEFNATALQSQGLGGFLKTLTERTGGSTEAMSTLFSSSEAVKTVLALTTADGADLTDVMEDMADKTGQTDIALKKVQESSSFVAKQFGTNVNVAMTRFGNLLLEFATPAMEGFNEVFQDLMDFLDFLPSGAAVAAEGLTVAFLRSKEFVVGAMLSISLSIREALESAIGWWDDIPQAARTVIRAISPMTGGLATMADAMLGSMGSAETLKQAMVDLRTETQEDVKTVQDYTAAVQEEVRTRANRKKAIQEVNAQIDAAIATLGDMNDESTTAVSMTKEQSRAWKALKSDVLPMVSLQEDYNKALELLGTAYATGVIPSTEEYAKAVRNLTSDFMEARKELKEGKDENEETASAFERAWTRAAERIDDQFVGLWKTMFEGVDEFMDGLVDTFKQMLAEMAHAAITRPIAIQIGTAMGLTGGGGLSSLGQGGGLLQSASDAFASGSADGGGLMGGIGGILSGGFSALKGGVASLWGNSGNLAAGAVGPPPAASGMSGLLNGNLFGGGLAGGAAAGLAGAGIGYFGGNMIGGLMGDAGDASRGGIGGAIGGAIGSIGGPIGIAIGTVLGGAIGSLVGGGQDNGNIQFQTGGSGFEGTAVEGAFGRVGLSRGSDDLPSELYRALPEKIAELDNTVAEFLTEGQIGSVTEAVQGMGTRQKVGQRVSDGELGIVFGDRIKTMFEALEAEVPSIVRRAAQGGSGVTVKQLMEQALPALQEAAALQQLLEQLGNFESSDMVSQLRERLNSETQLVDTYRRAQQNAIDLAGTFDRSKESATALTNALQSQAQVTQQLVTALVQVGEAASRAFQSTAQQIRESVLNEEELYSLRRQQISDLRSELETAEDPAEINRISGQINQFANDAFSLLGEDQQQALAPEFLNFLQDAEAAVGTRVDTLLGEIGSDQAELEREVAAAMNDAASIQQDAALNFRGAVEDFRALVNEGGGSFYSRIGRVQRSGLGEVNG